MPQSDDRLLFSGLLKTPTPLSRQPVQIVNFLSELCEKVMNYHKKYIYHLPVFVVENGEVKDARQCS